MGSIGDMHFSQGDGEVSFCGAIEMSGFLDLRCTVIKGGMKMLPAVGSLVRRLSLSTPSSRSAPLSRATPSIWSSRASITLEKFRWSCRGRLIKSRFPPSREVRALVRMAIF